MDLIKLEELNLSYNKITVFPNVLRKNDDSKELNKGLKSNNRLRTIKEEEEYYTKDSLDIQENSSIGIKNTSLGLLHTSATVHDLNKLAQSCSKLSISSDDQAKQQEGKRKTAITTDNRNDKRVKYRR